MNWNHTLPLKVEEEVFIVFHAVVCYINTLVAANYSIAKNVLRLSSL